MLLVNQHIEKDGSGHVTLRRMFDLLPSLQSLDLINFACSPLATAQEDEDMWHAYNLIQQGDEIRGSAVRYYSPFFLYLSITSS